MPTTPERFKLLGHRPSSLPMAFYCGQSPKLNAEHGTGRAALMGTYFHAVCSGDPAAIAQHTLLTKDERDEINKWHAPLPITVNGVELVYANAEHEVPVGLTLDGEYASEGEVLTGGTLDLAWLYDDVAYVEDIKKRTASVPDGPKSLQVKAYGWAYAKKVGARYLCTGLWDATEGFHLWDDEILDLESFEAIETFNLICAAALNNGEYVTGSHCQKCWGRLHCPEHVLPAIVKQTELAALATGDITPENAPELLRLAFAMEDVAEVALRTMKAYVAQGGVIRDRGKTWKPIPIKGREYCTVSELREGLGADAEAYIKRSRASERFEWVKE